MSSFRLMWFAFDAYFKGCVNIVIDGAWIKERVPGGCCIGGFSGYGLGPVLRQCSDAWQVVTTVHSTVSLTDISFLLNRALRSKAPADTLMFSVGSLCTIVIL